MPQITPSRVTALVSVAVTLLALVAPWLAAQEATPPQEVQPPQEWSPELRETFFDDPLDKLIGPRPDYGQRRSTAMAAANAGSAAASGEGSTDSGWSKLIAADALEDEIKTINQQLPQQISTPSAFKGGEYRDARVTFSTLAVLFAIAAEHDAQPRWHDDAAAFGQLFARAGANCKVGTDQSYKEAKLRLEDLAALVRGSRPDAPAANPDVTWPSYADRPP